MKNKEIKNIFWCCWIYVMGNVAGVLATLIGLKIKYGVWLIC